MHSQVADLEAGSVLTFRVVAVNKAGPGAASPSSDPVRVRPPSQKPKIDRRRMDEEVTVKIGAEVNLEVAFTGEPPPKVTWTFKDGGPLPDKAKVNTSGNEQIGLLFVYLLCDIPCKAH